MDDLLRYRDQFPILKTTTYLISNSLGAMPQHAHAKLIAAAKDTLLHWRGKV